MTKDLLMITKLKKLMVNRKIKILSKFIIIEKINIYLAIEEILQIY